MPSTMKMKAQLQEARHVARLHGWSSLRRKAEELYAWATGAQTYAIRRKAAEDLDKLLRRAAQEHRKAVAAA